MYSNIRDTLIDSWKAQESGVFIPATDYRIIEEAIMSMLPRINELNEATKSGKKIVPPLGLYEASSNLTQKKLTWYANDRDFFVYAPTVHYNNIDKNPIDIFSVVNFEGILLVIDPHLHWSSNLYGSSEYIHTLRKIFGNVPQYHLNATNRQSVLIGASMVVLTTTPSVKMSIPDELATYISYKGYIPPSNEDYVAILKSSHNQGNVGTINEEEATALAMEIEKTNADIFDAQKFITRTISSERRKITKSDISEYAKASAENDPSMNMVTVIKNDTPISYFGGYHNITDWLNKRAKVFSSKDIPSRGIIVTGIPGCGKSMVARVASSIFSVPLVKFGFSDIYGKHYGESEANLKKTLAAISKMAPCVVLMDEIEKDMARDHNFLTGVVLSMFLNWMQERPDPGSDKVFIVATANKPDELPPETMRKGRFDEVFFFDLPTEEERFEILSAHLGRHGINFARNEIMMLAAKTDHFSGAELESLVTEVIIECQDTRPNLPTALQICSKMVPLYNLQNQSVETLREWQRTSQARRA